jgi:transposase
MILSTKWLESGKFVFPPVKDGAICMSPEQFNLLVAALDWTRVQREPVKRPTKAA